MKEYQKITQKSKESFEQNVDCIIFLDILSKMHAVTLKNGHKEFFKLIFTRFGLE